MFQRARRGRAGDCFDEGQDPFKTLRGIGRTLLAPFRYPEVAPISGHRSVDLSGAAGGLGDYMSGAGSQPPHLYPQKRAVYRSSQVTAILLFDGAVVGSVHGGAPKLVAVATPSNSPNLVYSVSTISETSLGA